MYVGGVECCQECGCSELSTGAEVEDPSRVYATAREKFLALRWFHECMSCHARIYIPAGPQKTPLKGSA